jgi:predicted RNA-binding protein YlqC (UPF0109 family)
MATKRAADNEAAGEDGIKKPRMDGEGADLQEVRVLIDNYEASVIIGRGGENVKKIRAETSAFVSILKSEGSGTKERVMQIKGTVEFNTAALKAIAELMINNANQKNADAPDAEPTTTHQFKLLVHKNLAGAIIGKGGVIIQAIQSETGARVSLSTEPLGGSSEKTVTISGTVDQVFDASTRILTQIRDNPVRSGTSTMHYVPGQTAFGVPPAGYQMPPQGMYGAPQGYAPQGYGMPQMGMGGPMAGAGQAMGAQKTEKIVIPTVCAGTVIGKQGSIIREINAQSGTKISVAAAEPTAPNDRVVSITGPASGIQAAIYLIRQRVESYQPPAGSTFMG